MTLVFTPVNTTVALSPFKHIHKLKPDPCGPVPQQPVTNGISREQLAQRGPRVYGVVHSTGSDHQPEVMARDWSASHLRDEMKYIREVSAETFLSVPS